jgi:hypothetical protein
MRPSIWVRNGVRTARGQQLFIAAFNIWKTFGFTPDDYGAKAFAVKRLKKNPIFSEFGLRALRDGLDAVLDAAPPPIEPRDRWLSYLRAWGADHEQARRTINSLVTLARPERASGLDRCFDRLTRWYDSREKIAAIERWIENMQQDPDWWPQLRSDRRGTPGFNAYIKAFKEAGGQLSKKQFQDIFKMSSRVAGNALCCLVKAVIFTRIGRGTYALSELAVEPYAPVRRRIVVALFNAYESGLTYTELATQLGLSAKAITFDVSFLRRIGIVKAKASIRRLGAPIKLSASAFDKIARGEPIYGRPGRWGHRFILLAPPEPQSAQT